MQKGQIGILILVGILVTVVAGYLVYFNDSNNQTKTQPVPQAVKSPTPPVTESTSSAETANWKTYRSNLIGIELKFPSAWTVSEKDEKVNKYIEINSPTGETKLSVFKNYIGGVAGFKQYKENQDIQIMGINTIKSYLTEDTEAQNVSMFINLSHSKDKYLIIGKWKINDVDSESLIDQILSTFRFD